MLARVVVCAMIAAGLLLTLRGLHLMLLSWRGPRGKR